MTPINNCGRFQYGLWVCGWFRLSFPLGVGPWRVDLVAHSFVLVPLFGQLRWCWFWSRASPRLVSLVFLMLGRVRCWVWSPRAALVLVIRVLAWFWLCVRWFRFITPSFGAWCWFPQAKNRKFALYTIRV